MKAPTKQRSIKATKRVDLWVDLRRKRVRIAHTTASVETMKRVLQDLYFSTSYDGSALALSREHLQD